MGKGTFESRKSHFYLVASLIDVSGAPQIWHTIFNDTSVIAHGEASLVQWIIGTSLLASTIIGLAVLGHMQGVTYRYEPRLDARISSII
jgi:hypothetical protein